jgi:hypothetical protein
MENVLCKFGSFNLNCLRPKKDAAAMDTTPSIPQEDIVFDVTCDYGYQDISCLSSLSHDITNIHLYSKDCKIIYLDGEYQTKFQIELKKIINKNAKYIVPASHYLQLEKTIKLMKTEQLQHIQRIYAYGRTEVLHNYFSLVDLKYNICGVLLIISKL